LPRVLAELASQAGRTPGERLAFLARTIAEEVGADSWVVSRVAADAATPVAASALADGEQMALPWSATSEWVALARTAGVELLAGDPRAPLADVRGRVRVGVVQVGDWVVELGSDADATLQGVLPTLRALAAVAVTG
jgi:hypothetical protein